MMHMYWLGHWTWLDSAVCVNLIITAEMFYNVRCDDCCCADVKFYIFTHSRHYRKQSGPTSAPGPEISSAGDGSTQPRQFSPCIEQQVLQRKPWTPLGHYIYTTLIAGSWKSTPPALCYVLYTVPCLGPCSSTRYCRVQTVWGSAIGFI